jgi:uracil-DNA glycosylase family 4
MELDPGCRRCRLWEGRTRVVPPDGDKDSGICLIGEAPGKNEDLLGRPFIGRSGKLLTLMLEEGGLPRESIMITNTVKCRPPGNRAPKRDEMQACFPYLEQELRNKRVLVCLGRSACRSILGRDVRLEDEANTTIEMEVDGHSIDVIPTYHPSACLRNLKARDGLRKTIALLMERYA